MINFNYLQPQCTAEHLGLIPYYFYEGSVFSAQEQMEQGYYRSAGGPPSDFFNRPTSTKHTHMGHGHLKYPGDRVMKPIATAKLGDETLYMYESAMFAIFQSDGSSKIWRLD